MGFQDLTLGQKALALFAFSAVLTTAIVVGVGFKTVDTNVVAFDYDSNALKLNEDDAYTTAGLEFIGPGHYFVTYTTLEQTLEYKSLTGRTFDGLQVTVAFQLQYLYDTTPDSLLALYYQFGTRKPLEKRAFRRIAKVAALDGLAKFTAYDVKQQQEEVASKLESTISHRLEEVFGATVTTLQLSDVTLPDAINTAITDTLTVEQNVIAAGNLQDTARVTAQTEVYEAELDAEVTVYTAESQATALLTAAEADASAIRTTLMAEADAYLIMFKTLQGHFPDFNSTDMLNYIWLESLQDSESASVVYDVDTISSVY